MSKNTYHYYVGFTDDDGSIKLITRIDNSTKTWFWDIDKAPKEFSKTTADDLMAGLLCNGVSAVVIKSYCPITVQPCLKTTTDRGDDPVK